MHRNMFDSLRVGWDCLESIGCEYFINLDSDTLVEKSWIAKLESIHSLYENEQPGCPFIVTGFNSASHETYHKADGYVLKKSVGGVNLFFQRSIYQGIVRSVLSNVNWDQALAEKLNKKKGSIVVTSPSVVQHIGESGLWSRPWNFDVADDFIE